MKVTISSEFNAGREVQKQILDAIETSGFADQSTFAIKLSLEEALVNAIRHGNKCDKNKKVQIEWNITRDQAEIIIEDQGPGFDRKCIPDPTADENLDKPGGRGVLLIETYMDTAEWTKNGRRLRMVKKNEK